MNFANIHLESENRHTDTEMEWVEDPRLGVMALLDESRMIIDGWEQSSDDRFHAQMEFRDWTAGIDSIYRFLERHIEADRSVERRTTLEIEDGHFHMRHQGREYEEEDPEEISIIAHNNRVTFSCFGLNGPWIYLFEEAENSQPIDDNNADRLLAFFEEIGDGGDDTQISSTAHFQSLDDELIKVGVQDHFENGHYQSAIQDAFKVLEARIRRLGGYEPDLVGVDLMHQAFNAEEGPLSIGETGSEKEGFLKLYSGSFQAYRNPAAHRPLDLDWQRAHGIINLVNFLLLELPDAEEE